MLINYSKFCPVIDLNYYQILYKISDEQLSKRIIKRDGNGDGGWGMGDGGMGMEMGIEMGDGNGDGDREW